MHLSNVFWEEKKLIVICIKHTMNMAWIKQQDQNNILDMQLLSSSGESFSLYLFLLHQ